MANSESAKKRVRQARRRTVARTDRMSSIRRHIRKVEEAILSGNKSHAKETFQIMQPKLMGGVNVGVFHRNTVARKLSRLSKRIKAMGV